MVSGASTGHPKVGLDALLRLQVSMDEEGTEGHDQEEPHKDVPALI